MKFGQYKRYLQLDICKILLEDLST